MTRALAGLTVVLLALRLYASRIVGFGDSEALYACWAIHPQPAYLDHPGLVGQVARAIGEGAVPTPASTHVVTAFVASTVPLLAFGAARAFGAKAAPAAAAAIVLAVVPEIAIGLFALTPDLLLAPLWLGSLAFAALGLRSGDGSSKVTNARAAALLAAGLLAGVATASKATGGLLVVALAVAYALVARRRDAAAAIARTIWPWAGLASGLVVLAPIVLYEAHTGWPLLRHRLGDMQNTWNPIANVAALLGGQLAYVSPVLVAVAFFVARDLFRERKSDALSTLLFAAFAVPFVPLVLFCLWSSGAEPHWLAPALLALPIHAARRVAAVPVKLTRIGAVLAGVMTLVAHAWVLSPTLDAMFPSSADPKVDIANELYGWPTAAQAVQDQMRAAATPFDPEGREVVVVGPHWTICAQLHAALPGIRVGCATSIRDDFDDWFPREEWRKASYVLWVTDNRFPGDGAEQLPAHVSVGHGRVQVYRGGRVARTFDLYLYGRTASGSRDEGPFVPVEAPRERVEEPGGDEHVRHAPLMRAGGEQRAVADGDQHAEHTEEPAEALVDREPDRGDREQSDEEDREDQLRDHREPRHRRMRDDQADELEPRGHGRDSGRDVPMLVPEIHEA
jgi:hypothetical protein